MFHRSRKGLPPGRLRRPMGSSPPGSTARESGNLRGLEAPVATLGPFCSDRPFSFETAQGVHLDAKLGRRLADTQHLPHGPPPSFGPLMTTNREPSFNGRWRS